jgi:RNA recognition motif-containing protein
MAHTQEKRIAMEAKLYVGNLPYTTVDADLQTLFSQAGTVKSAQVIKDRQSGRSKGFGFVEMSSEEEAQSAITMFHGKDYSGRPLTVNIARPRDDRPGGGGGGFRNGGGRRPGGGDRNRNDAAGATTSP